MIPVILLTAAAFIVSLKLKISPERSKLVSRALSAKAKGERLDDADERELDKIKRECF
jgi:hypothetical protein